MENTPDSQNGSTGQNHDLAQQLNDFYQISPNPIIILTQENRIYNVNPVFLKILGYTESDLSNANFSDLINPEELTKCLAELTKLSKGESSVMFSVRMRRKDGAYTDLAWTFVAKNSFTYGIAHVASNYHETQKQLQAKIDELENLNKLMIGREIKMADLKEDNRRLREKLENNKSTK